MNEYVDRVMPIQEPFKQANRNFHPEDSIIDVQGVKIAKENCSNGESCSVESEAQLLQFPWKAYKPWVQQHKRWKALKPQNFSRVFLLHARRGLDLLKNSIETDYQLSAKLCRQTKLNVLCRCRHNSSRRKNMQNFELLKELGKQINRILLKRGLSATIEEWLMSAEYITLGAIKMCNFMWTRN